MKVAPIFILASERSGTNLLRRRITERQGYVFGPAPLHFLKHLYYAEPYYGALSQRDTLLRYVKDALGLAYHHFAPWDTRIEAEEVAARYSEFLSGTPCAVGVMHVIYSIYAQSKGYQTYLCKDNHLFDFVEPIRAALPDARFIYLYRDPRDVVASQLKRPGQIRSVSYLSELWRDEQIRCITHVEGLEGEGKLRRVSYEALVTDENAAIEAIIGAFNLKGLPGRPEAFAQEHTLTHEWCNLQAPTMRDNTGKFRDVFSSSTLRKIEGICWHQMKWLGYTTSAGSRPGQSRYRNSMSTGTARVQRALTSRLFRKGVTAAQRDRAIYVRKLQEKWR